ncbi:MAG: type II secretion system protein, partial [Planctomycetes bacterium]|nr:type II secretion system protein [Planctomycetota bacterium]
MQGRTHDSLTRRGMTLVELLVAVAILVVMIAGVGYIFSTTSKAVRHAQAVIDTNAALRVVSGRLREDLESLSPDGFLCLVGATRYDSGPDRGKP